MKPKQGRSSLPRSLLDKKCAFVKPTDRTPVIVFELEDLFSKSQYNPQKAAYLADGFSNDFRLSLNKTVKEIHQSQRTNKSKNHDNHWSAMANPKAVEEKLVKEIKAKRMIGPFQSPVFKEYCVSPLGLTKKKEPG